MQNERLKITGMCCDGCTIKVTEALQALPGVSDIKVSLEAGEAALRYDERQTSPEQLKAAVNDAGYALETDDMTQKSAAKGCGCGCG
ncbi:MAG: heavy-metal-associated domain-containing protein [Thiohalomonadales bacterium]